MYNFPTSITMNEALYALRSGEIPNVEGHVPAESLSLRHFVPDGENYHIDRVGYYLIVPITTSYYKYIYVEEVKWSH